LENENPILRRVLQLLSFAMIGIFFVLGFFLIFTPLWNDILPQPNRTILIFILFVYGSFRGWRAWKKFRE
jgi:uncharacterized membrane protein